MAERVYDRRGRKNWDDGVRTAEDERVTGRRAEVKRGGDRRQAERRVGTTVVDPDNERRTAERRQGERRVPLPANPTVRQLLGERLGSVHVLSAEWTIREAADFLATNRIGLAVIGTEQGGLVGVLSERDIVRAIATNGADGLYQTVDAYMTRGVWACGPEDDIDTVIALMREHRLRHLPVLDDSQLIGMISTTDIINHAGGLGGLGGAG